MYHYRSLTYCNRCGRYTSERACYSHRKELSYVAAKEHQTLTLANAQDSSQMKIKANSIEHAKGLSAFNFPETERERSAILLQLFIFEELSLQDLSQ